MERRCGGRILWTMGRLPFDPSKMAQAARSEPTTTRDGVLSVTQLAGKIEEALARIASPLRVIGEVSGFRDRTHWYFDLKDAQSVVNGVMFASAARKVGFTPANGQEVVATGRVEFYAKGGKVTLLIEKLEPVGAGALELAYRALCEELRNLGWFAPERKRRLPAFPRRIAIVTSKTGAALQDVLVTMNKRCPAVGALVVDVRVQGENAAPEIAEAIQFLSANAHVLGVDAILVTRGGGSMEDLWAFNERVVAQAIYECAIPVVAAIGHETDTTIAELVADERGATPTQAAMRLTPDRTALMHQITALQRRLSVDVTKRVRFEQERVRGLSRHALFSDPGSLVSRARKAVDVLDAQLAGVALARMARARERVLRLEARLERRRPAAVHAATMAQVESLAARLGLAMRARLDRRTLQALGDRLTRAGGLAIRETRSRLESAHRQLLAVGPQGVLERGYSCTMTEDGRALRSASEARAGERLHTRLAKGEVRSIVEGGASNAPPPPSSATAGAFRPRKLARPAKDPHQHGLFGE
jgi:exodeoxyribonuclease VII large subunit